MASNPAFAVGDYSNQTWNNDVDYYKNSIDESGIYEDSTLTDWHWYIAGDPNNGDTTDDGFCFMYDGGNYGGHAFAVINAIQPHQCAFYDVPEYQNIQYYDFFDLNLIAEPEPAPIGIYQEQQAYVGVSDDETNIFGAGAEYWSGCYSTGNGSTWADNQGAGGGECPIINNDSDQINFGYVQQTLSQISAIDTALKNAGLETTGYQYSWRVKNADANFEDTNGAQAQDALSVTLSIKDNGGNTVYEKTYDYSYHIDTWTTMSGEENFAQPFDLSTLEAIQLDVTAQDIGGWEGWYGPEFDDPNVVIKYRPIIEDNTEQLLFEQMCMNDSLYDVNCPGYQTAMIDQMNQVTNMASAEENIFGEDPAITGTTEQIAEATGAIVDDGSDSGSDNGMPDPVQEAVAETIQEAIAEPIQEAVAEATPEPVQEATEQTTETVVAEATGEPKSVGPGLNATQLSVLNAANNVTNNAVSSSTAAAQASAGIGLTESGGVSSTLTSVDPTGSTSADGSVASSTDFSGGTDGSTVATVEPMQNTNAGQTFDSSQVAAVDSSVSNTSGSDTGNTQTFDSSQGTTVDFSTADSSTASVDITQTFGSSQDTSVTQSFGNSGSDNGQSQNSSTGSNNGSQSNGSFGTTDFASTGQTAQDSNPLADGGALETNDITGEQDLATSNEALTQLAMLNDPTNPINQIINDITANMITQAVADAEETAEESAEDSVESQNAQEDALVAEALAGSDDEDAQAALLGYNPNFRAYQQPQMQGGEIYADQGVYENQKTYDSPRAGLFNGASDALHREMVRSQYD